MVQPLVVKFGGLLIKTLTKPVAYQIKSKATRPGWIRQACLRYGRLHHNIESRIALRSAGHHAKSIKPMEEEAAVSLGASVFSEVFVFSVAGGVLLWELQKKAQDDEVAKQKKDAQAAKERQDLEERFQRIEAEMQAMKQKHDDLQKEHEKMLKRKWL